jgi:hypothetical protein
MPKQESPGLTLYTRMEYMGKSISAEEFLEIARQNNAFVPPEESEKRYQETLEFFERYHLRSDWLGSPYFVDTHDPLQRIADGVHTGICIGGLFCFAPFLFFYFLFAVLLFVVGFSTGFFSVWEIIICVGIMIVFFLFKQRSQSRR